MSNPSDFETGSSNRTVNEALLLIDSNILQQLDLRSKTIACYCVQWYCQDSERCVCLLNILQRKAGYSLRTIDWMVTNYFKRCPVTISYNGNPLDVHHDYERHLSVYNKRFYDPFARREKISITLCGVPLQSTVGQLNFFRWFIERNLHEQVVTCRRAIEEDMRHTSSREGRYAKRQDTIVHRGVFDVGFV